MISVLENLDRTEFDARGWAWGADKTLDGLNTLSLAVPRAMGLLLGKFGREAELRRALEYRFLKSLKPGSIAWIFPGFDAKFIREAKRRGATIVLERINASEAQAKLLLDAAGERIGLDPNHRITREKIDAEAEAISLSDYLFVPSPFVRDSYLKDGVDEKRLISTSYGWNDATFAPSNNRDYGTSNPQFLFLARGIVRKGLPDLLTAWKRANVSGRLRIVGELDPIIATTYADVLNRDDVEVLGFQNDLVKMYREADVFVLPSIEEGSPLVTYLALAAGLPSLLSHAGAGGIVQNGVNGLIREADDADGLVEGLSRLAQDSSLREQLGRAARASATEYVWANVGKRRGELFRAML